MKILLLTDIPPCTNYTAGIVIQQLCDFLVEEGHSIACFNLITASLTPDIPTSTLTYMPYLRYDKPSEDWGHRYGKIGSLICNNYIAIIDLPRIAKKVMHFANKENVELIWSIVQGQSMIKLVRKVASNTGLPYTVQVWDSPEWWLSEYRFDKYTTKSVMKEFGYLLKNSKTCLVASWPMAEEYGKIYGAHCIPVIPGLDDSVNVIQESKEKANSDFIIGFSGQLYAIDEFNVLISALKKLDWKHNGKNIKCVLYGAKFNMSYDFPVNIQIRGWLKQDDLLNELASTDLLYCPYWFSEQFEKIARLSFPSKLTSYLKTKIPVLVHAPDYSSSSRFIKDNAAGYLCNSNKIDDLVKIICEIIDDPNRNIIGNYGYEAFKKYLTFKTMKKSFFDAIGI